MTTHHAAPASATLIMQSGERIEYCIEVDPQRYLPVHLAIGGWLQEFPLESVIDAWWLAQKERQEREFTFARQEAERRAR